MTPLDRGLSELDRARIHRQSVPDSNTPSGECRPGKAENKFASIHHEFSFNLTLLSITIIVTRGFKSSSFYRRVAILSGNRITFSGFACNRIDLPIKTMVNLLNGILPAVVTPFDKQGRFAPAAFEQLLDVVFAAGVHGIYVCGQTGEGLLQPIEQRKKVAEVAVRCAPVGKTIVVHVGAAELEDAKELARHSESIGATAISSLPPVAASPDQVRTYYRGLAESCELPLLLYYFPEVCPAITDPALLTDLLKLPHVVGLKFTDFDLFRLWKMRRAGQVVFNGRDEVLSAGLLMGASGGIGTFYNLAPELFLKIWNLAQEGRWEEARPVQGQVNELIEIVLRFPMFPAIKQILSWSGIDCGGCLPPNRNLSADEQSRLRKLLAQSEVGRVHFAGTNLV
jgi:N-acetylneuraminate lyase